MTADPNHSGGTWPAGELICLESLKPVWNNLFLLKSYDLRKEDWDSEPSKCGMVPLVASGGSPLCKWRYCCAKKCGEVVRSLRWSCPPVRILTSYWALQFEAAWSVFCQSWNGLILMYLDTPNQFVCVGSLGQQIYLSSTVLEQLCWEVSQVCFSNEIEECSLDWVMNCCAFWEYMNLYVCYCNNRETVGECRKAWKQKRHLVCGQWSLQSWVTDIRICWLLVLHLPLASFKQ